MIGLSTYAFFWQHSERAPQPLTLEEMLRRTHALDVEVFQICDFQPLLGYSEAQLRDVLALADDLGIHLELGTRGVQAEHLARFLRMAEILKVGLVRSMINTADHRPTLAEAQRLLEEALPAYEDLGVNLALETYEQISSKDLVSLVETVASPSLGICLDPANSLAALETPNEVIDRCAFWTTNIHVKDFAFTRRDGWVGFTLEGAELGSGLLDYEYLMRTVDPQSRGINRIIEHWLPWQGSFEETAQIENRWTEHNLAYLRSNE
ncbi:sugar phosphate isomerase/epimerase family protein [Planctomonas deserti]|uniref:sugar phosphate isomerase/epimerase family protein n=1 Tax=Planctomonas deserti TaxID=2144185 RepID=UPI000D34C9C9|nr:TIM barrel protein [Planctomonas deserti]